MQTPGRYSVTSWFEQLKGIVNRHEPAADEHALARAAAVVLLEMAAADDHFDPSEQDIVHEAMAKAFDLDGRELDELIAEAKTLRQSAVSLHDYTRSLRTGLPRRSRDELIGWLWRVAFADGHLDRYEEQLLRRLADLLGVPHEEFIRQKHLAGPGQ
ncbi:MAG: TerB family tellurite resistance protein [Wenzhouxiangella sp.]|nr:MAG: TerB family tellurite resistance protein [Wenzhouxiangella sp.]